MSVPLYEPESERRGKARYRVGCAGMFVLGTDYGVHDELDALAAACAGPPGCEVLDTATGAWIGPYCQEDADDIRARLEARSAPAPVHREEGEG